jgi:hypothetical protein
MCFLMLDLYLEFKEEWFRVWFECETRRNLEFTAELMKIPMNLHLLRPFHSRNRQGRRRRRREKEEPLSLSLNLEREWEERNDFGPVLCAFIRAWIGPVRSNQSSSPLSQASPPLDLGWTWSGSIQRLWGTWMIQTQH